jgi:membrane protease YdiL (CAAX protease family)
MFGGFMENKIPVRFFLITFLWSWLCWIPPIILNEIGIVSINNFKSSPIGVLIIFGAFGPAVGAFVSLYTIDGKGAIKRYLKSFLSLNFGWKAWLVIFLVTGLSPFIAWIVPELFGVTRFSPNLPSIYILPLYMLVIIFFGGGQEEIGWRGYILSFLEKRFGLIIGSLILGIIWAIWHIPLWFIPGANQIYMNFFGFVLMCIGGSFFYSWVIAASGKRLLSGIIVHGLANGFLEFFPLIIMDKDSKQPRFLIFCILVLIVGIITVMMRKYKTRKYGT